MYLATHTPDAKFDGERILLSVPSGRDKIEIALTIHQAGVMAFRLHGAHDDAFAAIKAANCAASLTAEIIALPIRSRA